MQNSYDKWKMTPHSSMQKGSPTMGDEPPLWLSRPGAYMASNIESRQSLANGSTRENWKPHKGLLHRVIGGRQTCMPRVAASESAGPVHTCIVNANGSRAGVGEMDNRHTQRAPFSGLRPLDKTAKWHVNRDLSRRRDTRATLGGIGVRRQRVENFRGWAMPCPMWGSTPCPRCGPATKSAPDVCWQRRLQCTSQMSRANSDSNPL
jgi:hypothetical protein